MSRIALLGSIFVAALFLVCVGFFISRRTVLPPQTPVVRKNPPPEDPVPASPAPEAHAAALPTPPPPARTKEQPSAVPASASSGAHFAVDSGLFQDRNNADVLAARIPKQYKTQITPLMVHGKKLYRVRTTVPTRSDADALAANLARDLHLQARIISLQQP